MNMNMKEDLPLVMKSEENPELKKMLEIAVGRIATIPEDRRVERQTFVTYIQEQDRRSRDCLHFPCMIMYFALFASVVVMHDDVSNMSQVERNFMSMIEGTSFEGTIYSGVLGPNQTEDIWVSGHKTMEDIDTVEDVWTWLRDAMIPLFIPPLNGTSAADLRRVLRYNRLIGGVQLQQIRRRRVSCTEQYPALGPILPGTNINPLLAGIDCFPPAKFSSECFGVNSTSTVGGFCPDAETSGRRLSGMVHDPRLLYPESQVGKVGREHTVAAWSGSSDFKGGTYTVLLHQQSGLAQAQETLTYLQDNHWIDTPTAWLGMKMFILNPDLKVYTYIVANVFFAPSGQQIPAVTMSSFPAEPYAEWTVIISDLTWLCVLFYLTLITLSRLIRAVRKPKTKLLPYLSDFFTWVDFFTVFGGIVILVLWIQVVTVLGAVRDKTMDVVLDMRKYSNDTNSSDFGLSDVDESSMELHTDAASFSSFLRTFRIIVAWYIIGIMLRFFQAFLAQPKLAVVSKTIGRSFVDTSHFLIVLVLVLLAYAVGGMCLFGHRLVDFMQLNTAMIACAQIALGDFDYDELAAEHPGMAAVWFWSYTVLVTINMLNMLLAIIMDWYSEVKAKAEGDDAIWVQSGKVVVGAWKKREWLKGAWVVEEISKLDDAITHIDKELLMHTMPDMTDAQATALIHDAETFESRMEEQGIRISDAVKMVSWIKFATLKVARRIESILDIQSEEKVLISGDDDEQEGDVNYHVDADGTKSKVRPRIRKNITLNNMADQRMQVLESRLSQMEAWLNESMCLTVQRGKDVAGRIGVIETLIKSQAEGFAGAVTQRSAWKNIPSHMDASTAALVNRFEGPPMEAIEDNALARVSATAVAATAPLATNTAAATGTAGIPALDMVAANPAVAARPASQDDTSRGDVGPGQLEPTLQTITFNA